MNTNQHLGVGEIIEVRSKREILATLDENGCLDGLPFMPEMFAYCGRRFRVYKRAHKTCDFVTFTGMRRLTNTVHLENLRCDGSAHGGCLAACLIFWKEAWLKPADDFASVSELPLGDDALLIRGHAGDDDKVWRAAIVSVGATKADTVFSCQATKLPSFTAPLSPWDISQYVEDYRSGNVPSLLSMIPRFWYRMYDNCVNLGVGLGPPLRWIYDLVQRARGGTPYPNKAGKLPSGSKTPAVSLDLRPGEWVRVKEFEAIRETIDVNCRNRGMTFSAEMVPYCGKEYRVRSKVDRLIDERTGRMLELKNSCVILEDVVCCALYNRGMVFCPRATFPYWREIWLERVSGSERAALASSNSVSAHSHQ